MGATPPVKVRKREGVVFVGEGRKREGKKKKKRGGEGGGGGGVIIFLTT